MKKKNVGFIVALFFSFIHLVSMENDEAKERVSILGLSGLPGQIALAKVIGETILVASSNQKAKENEITFNFCEFASVNPLSKASITTNDGYFTLSGFIKNLMPVNNLMPNYSADQASVAVYDKSSIYLWDMNSKDGFVEQRLSSLSKIKTCQVGNGSLAILYGNKVIISDSQGQYCEYDAEDYDHILFTQDDHKVLWNKKVIKLPSGKKIKNDFSRSNKFSDDIMLCANRSKPDHLVSVARDTISNKIGLGSFTISKEDNILNRSEITIDRTAGYAFPKVDVEGENILVVWRNVSDYKWSVYDSTSLQPKSSSTDKVARSVDGLLNHNVIKFAKIVGQRVFSQIVDMRQEDSLS